MQSLLSFLSVAFLAGLATIFMPCIYPIMPMTVSFFTKQQNGKSKALFYGLSIMVIFGLIGFLTMATGASFLNFISTHWLPNLLFFTVFIIFGISLLGFFEIVLPHNLVNKVDGMSDSGGWIGIFFMALTLVVVSFSCTAPFVGSLLVMAAQGEVFRPLWGMLAFGLPFAIVFSSLAMFPQWLKSLPKSGGWMNEMKAVMGLAEFALALKFLSNIDQTYHFGLISRSTFLICWIIIFAIVALYIAGIIRLPKDSKVKQYVPSRIFFIGLFLVFSGYMITGISGKSLPILAGILPPIENVGTLAGVSPDKLRPMAYGLVGFSDYDEALSYAKKVNKPVFIDFTGYACANCRKMEESVWVNPEVLNKLRNDFVIASLYVDDKKELSKNKQYTSSYDDELKTTIGDKNMDLEITKFNNNAQPFYAIVSPNGKVLNEPIGYSKLSDFVTFLDSSKQ